jgi:hypothetical protein
MAALIECMVCMEGFDTSQIGKACESPVGHMLCFGCELKWRDKCGGRMTCPSCRQEEHRTYESFKREEIYRTYESIYRTYESTTSSISTSHMLTFAAQVAAEMAQAVQIVRDIRRREEELADYRERTSSAVARPIPSTLDMLD